MCGNEVLKERIDNLAKSMEAFHKDFREYVKNQDEKRSELDKKYVTRNEFAAVKRVWWVFIWIVWMISTVVALFHK